ncbi:lysophospholipid acyltransferase family protein [Saccharopolyspora sp. CA-218241]|uniref:lysophospholipid acyltransferase family protein n=1 Tax=Saccharopolyspora sp. CA-218241 TaxID=3240027 RepID=UPI003D98E176
MVALPSGPHEPTRRHDTSETSRVWRSLMLVDRWIVGLAGRLVVTGDLPDEVRGRPVLLTANHIGDFDALVLIAACRARGAAPRILATAGLFDAPVLGGVLRSAQHIRVERGGVTATAALEAVGAALAESSRPVLVYPEGRISLEPGLWPERGKSGAARMALAAEAVVVPVSQWGAHEVLHYGEPTVTGARDLLARFRSFCRGVRRRPALRVHFGQPVDLSDLSAERVGDAVRARDRIMRAITDGLVPLRADEPDRPRHHDPTRPVNDKRSPWRP